MQFEDKSSEQNENGPRELGWVSLFKRKICYLTGALASACGAGYRRVQLFLNIKVKRKLLKHHIKPDNIHTSISSHLHLRIGKNC